jgi:hypothetical protein
LQEWTRSLVPSISVLSVTLTSKEIAPTGAPMASVALHVNGYVQLTNS